MQLHVLSGGAAQGLVQAVAAEFTSATGLDIAGTFGAVGAMRDKLLAGSPVDLLILTKALIAELEEGGHVVAGSAIPIGVVRTGIAIRAGDPEPGIADARQLSSALTAADGIFCPDPKLATAGIHFARVLASLGIAAECNPRLCTYPNGATAMRELAASKLQHPIGCTQVTEILNTSGVRLVGLLPGEFELATVYAAAVASKAAHPDAAHRLAAMLVADGARKHRDRLGFEAR